MPRGHDGFVQFAFVIDHAHAFTPSARRGFDEDRIANNSNSACSALVLSSP